LTSKRWWTTGIDWIDILYPPYTAMVLSYVLIGACLAPEVSWTLTGLALLAYFLGVGVAAHCFDEAKGHPLGTKFSDKALLASGSLVMAVVGLMALFGFTYLEYGYLPGWLHLPGLPESPGRGGWGLLAFAALEGFSVFAYSLELFGGRFHNDFWFVFSWSFLPTLFGYYINALRLDAHALLLAAALSMTAVVETRINHWVKRMSEDPRREYAPWIKEPQEAVQATVALTMLLALSLLAWRLFGPLPRP